MKTTDNHPTYFFKRAYDQQTRSYFKGYVDILERQANSVTFICRVFCYDEDLLNELMRRGLPVKHASEMYYAITGKTPTRVCNLV